MRIGTNTFRGELPHLAPEALPDEGAQEATNCRLETGNLQAYRQFALTKTLAGSGVVETIFLAQHPTTTATAWLSFNDQVDIARNVIEDDPDGLLLLTCPDLYATPVYTTYAAATAGAEPFPVAGSLLPLGVPGPSDIPTVVLGLDPTPTTFSIDTLDAGDELDTKWTHSAFATGSGLYSEVKQEAAGGNPGSCYGLYYDESRPSAGPWAYRKMDTAPATVITVTADFKFTNSDEDQTRRAGLAIAVDQEGIGCAVQVSNGNRLTIVNQVDKTGWYGQAVLDSVACALSHSVWYTFDVNMTVNTNGTQTVTAKVLNGVTVIATLTATSVWPVGDYVGINAASGSDAAFRFTTLFDNIHVKASGATGITPNLTATSYVYTFVNNRGWESVPSLPTSDVLRPDGVSVTVTTSTTAPAGYSAVTLKRIYRLVSATTGDLFLLVAEIPLAQATYVDTLTDNLVGPDVLGSQDFDLPPADLQGILALPNGGYAGFFGRQLCISAAGWPHAWPVSQRHSCEFDIVAIGKLGNTIFVGTTGRPYTCTGTEPPNYVMSEPGESQACTSKVGMVFLDGQGVAFPSPDGYQVCAGSAGSLRNLTENVFTKTQWQALGPESILAAVHDGVLHWYWESGSASGSYALDPKPSGFGLIRLSHHATAVYVDAETDALYVVMDENDEPTDTLLPTASTAVVPTGHKIFEFNATTGSGKMVYRWRGKLNMLVFPQALRIGRVRAVDYANLIVRHYADGVLLKERQVTDRDSFTVPARKSYETYEIELVGTSDVRETVLVDDMREFG